MGSKTLFIMNFEGEKIGEITQTEREYVQELNGEITRYSSLPPILSGIVPAPTQFPEVNDILDYYRMNELDIFTYLGRSNGIKGSRDCWFMIPPVGEVWIPLFIDEKKYRSFESLLKVGAEVTLLMSGQAYVLRRTLDVIPKVLKDYLVRDGETRFSTIKGEVYDLVKYPAQKGLVGRIILYFPPIKIF